MLVISQVLVIFKLWTLMIRVRERELLHPRNSWIVHKMYDALYRGRNGVYGVGISSVYYGISDQAFISKCAFKVIYNLIGILRLHGLFHTDHTEFHDQHSNDSRNR